MSFENRRIRQVALFYAIAIALSTLCAIAAPWFGEGILFLTMLTPAVAVAVCRVVSPEGVRFHWSELGLSRLGLRHWPLALMLPLIVLSPGYLFVWAAGLGEFTVFGGSTEMLRVFVSFMLGLVLGATLGALGEEVGWRGYMLPRLVDALGTGKAGLLSGFLHGFWHVPLILLTPHYHAETPAIIAVPLFLVAVTLSGPIFAHLRLASASIIPVAIMHQAWNGYWESLSELTATSEPALVAALAGEAGILTIVMLAAVAFWLNRRCGVSPLPQSQALGQFGCVGKVNR